MDEHNHSMLTVLKDMALRIPNEWLVSFLVLFSMSVQLVLVICGARRYLSSSSVLRSVVWIAYIVADAVAISALGTMMQSDLHEIYGIWAPVLLLHLGGPDAITAYSMADNELWLRHGFNMIYQVSVAVYVMYVSDLEGQSLVSAILLLVVGVMKYAERTTSLRCASYSQIVKSIQPIYQFMELLDPIQSEKYTYFIMGEKPFHGEWMKVERKSLVRRSSLSSLLEGRGVVTVMDAMKDKGMEGTDYTLCLSHALFKMYKRRFVSLKFFESDRPKIRIFLFNLAPEEVFRIVETELKFMYDVLFSKSSGTAFSKWGPVVRLLNTVFLGAACSLLLFGLRVNPYSRAQRAVTHILISVALVMEVYQLCRILVSDWTRVRLICERVEHLRRPRAHSGINWYRLKMIGIAMWLVRKVQNLVGFRYWMNGIKQYCMIQTCLNSSPYVWKVAGVFNKQDSFILGWYIKVKRIHTEAIPDDLRVFIFKILKEKCSPEQDIEMCRRKIYNFEQYLFTGDFQGLLWAAELGLGEAILTWHIATTICDKEREGSRENENDTVRFSRTLSRYCAYLLLSRPNLLPLHADIARILIFDVHFELFELVKEDNRYKNAGLLKEHKKKNVPGKKNVLGNATKLTRQLLKKEQEQRWKLLAEYWASLLIYMATYNKAPFHSECLATGGEFLSQVWVLLGHMGCGEQADSPVTKKMERKKMEREEKITIEYISA